MGRNCMIPWWTFTLMLFLNLGGALNCIVYGITNKAIRKNYPIRIAIVHFLLAPVILIPGCVTHFLSWLMGNTKKNTRGGDDSQSLVTQGYLTEDSNASSVSRSNYYGTTSSFEDYRSTMRYKS